MIRWRRRRPDPYVERQREIDHEDSVGPMSGYAVANLKAEFIASEGLEGSDFEGLLDVRLGEWARAAERREAFQGSAWVSGGTAYEPLPLNGVSA